MKKLAGYIIVLSSSVWAQNVSPTINQTPTRQFGHPGLDVPLTQATPNLVEGRELDVPGQIAFDTSVNPPILYVADILNNRVLAFKNPAALTAGNFADLVIGQEDKMSTLTQGPSSSLSTFTTGFNTPTGVAVDSSGNLYVADAGNNRILRFPAPFGQAAGNAPQPDLVIGQKSFNAGYQPNENGNVSSKTIYLSSNGTTYLTSLAVDASNNLWVTDPGNNRVLMFPASNLTAGAVEPVATVVLGQNDFVTRSVPGGVTQLSKGSIVIPAGLAFDSTGNLYVVDSGSRVLYFPAPFAAQGQSATRILGISPTPPQGQPATTYPNQYSLGVVNPNNNSLIAPNGVFTLGNHLFVADTGANRIVEYDIPSNWAQESTASPSPAAIAVIGQPGYNSGKINLGQPQPNQFTLSSPYAGAFVGSQLWVADSGNNRLLAYAPNAAGTYVGASAVVGQLDFIYNAPNLIEGKEVYLSGGLASGSASGIVVDKNSTPQHLYVADPGNNRILCFNDVHKVGQNVTATFADLVIGQVDFKSSVVNYPSGVPLSPSATGLNNPIGVAVDNNGNLYVADFGNGRVLRFPAPFNVPAGQPQTANLVLGQSGFSTVIQNATSNSMRSPWGVALFAGSDANATPLAGGLAVSDPAYNRVLFFSKPAGGDFTNGQNAYLVIGQPNFTTVSSGSSAASFSGPRGIAADTSDRLYVADYGNSRVMAFNQAPQNLSSGPTSTQQYPNIYQVEGVALSSITTELWVTATGSGQILRFPEYTRCQLYGCNSTAQLYANAATLGLALDASDNVIVGDSSNRITFYYAQAFYRNAANFNTQALAPGMLAILGRLGLPMVIKDGAAPPPWPTTLADLSLTVNGTPATIFLTLSSFGAIYFQVPSNAPTSGTANFVVTRVSTSEILAVGTFLMAKSNPGFFTLSANGLGQLAAQNSDFTTNGPSNQVARGGTIILYLTGQGQVPNAPPDGQTPVGSLPTPTKPLLIIGGVPLTDAEITYSGLGAFPGGWQINAVIDLKVPPGTASVVLSYNGVPSNIGGYTNPDGSPGADVQKIITTISVK